MINVSRFAMINKALALVGDYTLEDTGISTPIGVYAESVLRSSVFLIFSNLHSVNNYLSVSLTGSPLVGDYYRYTIPSTNTLIKPQYIIIEKNNEVVRTINFTDLLLRETKGVFIEPSGVTNILNIHKDWLPNGYTIADVTFTYFYMPNIDTPALLSATIPIDEMVYECVSFKTAASLAMYIANDINLNQLFDNQAKELLTTIQGNRDLGYGRPYYARFRG